MTQPTITLAYDPADEPAALVLAQALEDRGFTFEQPNRSSVLVAQVSADGVANPTLKTALDGAISRQQPLVLVADTPLDLPPQLAQVTPTPSDPEAVAGAIRRAARSGINARNRRLGLVVGIGIFTLFLVYLWAIIVFDIEAPQEDFERAYTHVAATVGMIAQPFIPVSTEQAEAFESTLSGWQVSDELATVIVGTATEAAAQGGFTPMPTGLIIAPSPMSEVRQLATESAIERTTATVGAQDDEQEVLAATATQSALDAAETLSVEQLTVTAAAE